MNRRLCRRGRPLGPIARAILETLSTKPMTSREIAAKLMLSLMATKYTCSRLVDAGHIAVVDRIPAGGSHKRIALFALGEAIAPGTVALAFFSSVTIGG